jgi:hypothetical protein
MQHDIGLLVHPRGFWLYVTTIRFFWNSDAVRYCFVQALNVYSFLSFEINAFFTQRIRNSFCFVSVFSLCYLDFICGR